MSAPLVAAAFLAALVAAAHSYLGERYILIRLFRRGDLPRLFGSDRFTRETLRLAWHLTSIAWLGFAVLVLLVARAGTTTLATGRLGAVVAVTFGLTALVTLIGSRGRHLAWPVFAAIALAVWYGTR